MVFDNVSTWRFNSDMTKSLALRGKSKIDTQPFTENPNRPALFMAVGKYRLYCALLCRELLGEFHHTPQAVEFWRKQVERFDDGAMSVGGMVDLNPSPLRDPLNYVRQQNHNALHRLVNDPDNDPVDATYGALEHLTKSKMGMKVWQQWMTADGWESSAPDPDVPSSEDNLLVGENQAWEEISEVIQRFHKPFATSVDHSRTSADAYLQYVRLLAIYPSLWRPELQKELGWVHRKYGYGIDWPASQHVWRRNKIIDSLSLKQFNMHAIEAPKNSTF